MVNRYRLYIAKCLNDIGHTTYLTFAAFDKDQAEALIGDTLEYEFPNWQLVSYEYSGIVRSYA
jgi:hypothetical protein